MDLTMGAGVGGGNLGGSFPIAVPRMLSPSTTPQARLAAAL